MKLSEKIQKIRKQFKLSQEQLANKLCVSRSAIAKWESGSGTPDIENLKALAQLCNCSIDYLVNDSDDEICTLKEEISLDTYIGTKKEKKDQIVRYFYPEAIIYTLLAEMQLSKSEKVIDNALGFLTNAPFGIPQLIHSIKNLDKEFYWVEQQDVLLLVMITDTHMHSTIIKEKPVKNTFSFGEWKLTKCKYQVK